MIIAILAVGIPLSALIGIYVCVMARAYVEYRKSAQLLREIEAEHRRSNRVVRETETERRRRERAEK
jgi:hypothetical protein